LIEVFHSTSAADGTQSAFVPFCRRKFSRDTTIFLEQTITHSDISKNNYIDYIVRRCISFYIRPIAWNGSSAVAAAPSSGLVCC